MRRPRIILAAILTTLVGLGGPAITPARAEPLSDLLAGGTLTSGEFTFSNFTYQPPSGPPDPADVTVTSYVDSSGYAGIQIGGAFVQSGTGSSDVRLGYTITDNLGARITDVHMDGNPFLTPTGSTGTALITESVYDPNVPSSQNPIAAGSIDGTSIPTSQTVTLNLPGSYATLNIQKDILLDVVSPGGSASVSFINQTFSTTVIPEPSSVVMMGLGVGLGGLIFRRRMAVKS